jgi:glycerol-3-phosphate acyltransferase PlsX
MARAVLHIERPRVGIAEYRRGGDQGHRGGQQAHAWLKENELPIDYIGFVEGDQIGQGIADVIVVEGFAGNIALKTPKARPSRWRPGLREALSGSIAAQVGAFLAQQGLRCL